jgi:hypothetical protein
MSNDTDRLAMGKGIVFLGKCFWQPVKNGLKAPQGCGAEFRRLSKSQENRAGGRSAFGHPQLKKPGKAFQRTVQISTDVRLKT